MWLLFGSGGASMFKGRIKRTIGKILIGIIAASAVIGVSGCGATALRNFANSNLYGAIADRFNHNLDILNQLKESNLIDENTYKATKDNIEKQKETYVTMVNGQPQSLVTIDENGKLGSGGALAPALSGLRTLNSGQVPSVMGDDGVSVETAGMSESDTNFYMGIPGRPEVISNTLVAYIISNYLASSLGMNVPSAFGSGDFNLTSIREPEPIVVITDAVQSDLNDRMDYTLYTLKPDIATIAETDGLTTDSIDGIFEMMNKYIKGEDGIQDNKLLNYFQAATYMQDIYKSGNKVHSKGDPVRLLDLADENGDFQIVKDSEWVGGYDYVNQPGKDLHIEQYDQGVLKIRFTEFDYEAFQKLISLVGSGTDRYIFSESDGVKRCYLMEYPVSYISEVESSGNTLKAKIETSGLSINLLTKEIFKHNSDGSGGYSINGTAITNKDNAGYLSLDGAVNNADKGKSAFILKGKTEVTIDKAISGTTNQIKVECGRLILRDYLEATYAPGFVDGENVVVFGRKLRFKNMQWTENNGNFDLWFKKMEPLATFVDIDGEEIAGAAELYAEHLADVEKLSGKGNSDPKLVRPTANGEAESKGSVNSKQGEKEVAKLDYEATNGNIKIATEFPGDIIGKADKARSSGLSNQLFYAVGTSTDLFQTSLFSSWINSEDATASLDWWTNWLGANNYVYSLNHSEINGYLYNNYAYELSQNGIIVLNLDTVAKIQEEYEREDNIETNRTIRTAFKVLGWGVIVFSVFVVLCWVFDTNTDIGIGLLEKISFGHWVAIKYEEDMPVADTEGRSYISFGKIMVKMIVLIVVGVLLILLDVFDIVVFLINMLGGIATQIGKLINGIK